MPAIRTVPTDQRRGSDDCCDMMPSGLDGYGSFVPPQYLMSQCPACERLLGDNPGSPPPVAPDSGEPPGPRSRKSGRFTVRGSSSPASPQLSPSASASAASAGSRPLITAPSHTSQPSGGGWVASIRPQ